jgi:hypothetical protein
MSGPRALTWNPSRSLALILSLYFAIVWAAPAVLGVARAEGPPRRLILEQSAEHRLEQLAWVEQVLGRRATLTLNSTAWLPEPDLAYLGQFEVEEDDSLRAFFETIANERAPTTGLPAAPVPHGAKVILGRGDAVFNFFDPHARFEWFSRAAIAQARHFLAKPSLFKPKGAIAVKRLPARHAVEVRALDGGDEKGALLIQDEKKACPRSNSHFLICDFAQHGTAYFPLK